MFVLLITFGVSLLIFRLTTGNWEFKFSGNLAMSLMLLFTAIGHFAFTKGMEMMLPDGLPLKKMIVYFSGCIEIATAIGLMISSLQQLTAKWLIVFLY